MHEIKKKYLLLSSVNTSVPYPGKSVYFLITIKTTSNTILYIILQTTNTSLYNLHSPQ